MALTADQIDLVIDAVDEYQDMLEHEHDPGDPDARSPEDISEDLALLAEAREGLVELLRQAS